MSVQGHHQQNPVLPSTIDGATGNIGNGSNRGNGSNSGHAPNGGNVNGGGSANHLAANALPTAPDPLLRCQWTPCTEHPTSAANLYDHLCEAHIGRKSTNNLSLKCGWHGCDIITVKRDHITSHVRVHVPLKPHSCPFCSKCFKRPQDLKKHVKTHADDSVLAAPPQQAPRPAPSHGGQNPGYGQVHSNHATGAVANLQNLAASSGGYYGQNSQMNHGSGGGYPPPHHAPSGYYHPQQPSSYGPVYYPVSHGGDIGQGGGYEFRKRYDALNDFFGDAKRRQIDPTSYAEVGSRLNVLEGLSSPGSSMADFLSTGPALASLGNHGGGPMVQQHHSLPSMPSLRTKNDLLNMDQFLNQVQATVYETTSPAARAGVHQPGAHYAPQAYRPSRSPPQDIHGMGSMASQGQSAQGTAPMRATHSSQSNSSGTPALTPSSSSVYSSGHSPTSSQGLSPHSSTSAPYPSLPANTAGYSPHSTAAPASTLGTNFDSDFRRRYSGGMLQRSAAHPESSPPRDDATSTPRAEFPIDPALSSLSGTAYPHRPQQLDSQIDPALLSPDLDDEDDHPEWVGHIRMVEKLREMVSKRLRQHQYEEEEGEDAGEVKDASTQDAVGLYPVLPEVDE